MCNERVSQTVLSRKIAKRTLTTVLAYPDRPSKGSNNISKIQHKRAGCAGPIVNQQVQELGCPHTTDDHADDPSRLHLRHH